MRVRTRQFFSNVPTDLLSEAKREGTKMYSIKNFNYETE